ncbi:MAG: WbqC family protein [Burkholderiales bacterium]|nr:WbqC family protein [Burkholderiales bacterium]
MKRVAVIQSNYLPWKGYFDIIHDVDLFIFYDCVQYTKNDWRNRNVIKTAAGPSWLTVPVQFQLGDTIEQARVANTHWQAKHFKTLEHAYRRQPGYEWLLPLLQETYLDREWTNLSELNRHLIQRICADYLGIETAIVGSSQFTLNGARQERLLDLLVQAGATHYVSGPAARSYIEEPRFAEAGIALSYKDYAGYPEYAQPYGEFRHAVSIVDVIACTGQAAPEYIWGWRA